MATRSRTTFKKRQKELARQEKQRDKAARRMQRKMEKMLHPNSGLGDELDGTFPDGEADGTVGEEDSLGEHPALGTDQALGTQA
jgi:hypothetical protein